MNRTEELIRKNRSAVERIAKEAKKRIGENPWFAYEWGKERIDAIMHGDCGAYEYGINRLVELMGL